MARGGGEPPVPGGHSSGAADSSGDIGLGAFIGGEVVERSVAELGAAMAAGGLTAEQAVQAYLARIEALDSGGPRLGSVIETNREALSIARERDAERRAGQVRGPLHGIPILLKDNLDTADGMTTSAGSLALAGSTAARDSTVATRLRAAGAVLLGKTNLSEWANFRSTRSSSGWSGRGGQCRNPYALDRSPCGSSSGSGAAPAASLCAVAIGTETDGSIVCPASFCGVAGFKPTVGLVSRAGIVPISHSQDTAGPMGRTVADLVLVLAIIQGADPRDPQTAAAPPEALIDPAAILDPNGLNGARLGVVRELFGFHPEVDRQMHGVLEALAAAGAELVDPVSLPQRGAWREAELEVFLYEFKHGLNAYLAALPAGPRPRTLAEIIEFNRANAGRSMPWFGQELFERAEGKGPLTEGAYLEALATCRRLARDEGIDAALSTNGLDALICPTTGPAYLIDWVNGDNYKGSASGPAAVAGYPHATVPAGYAHGLPWGLSIFGAAWSDARILRYAFAFEQATKVRRPPELPATAPLAG